VQDRVKVKDKLFEPMISAAEITSVVDGIARRINADYAGKEPLFLCVLNGSFIFASDLLRKIDLPCRLSFVKYASYTGIQSTQSIKTLLGLNEELAGTDVIIVEDIVDSGLTMSHLLEELSEKNPASVRIATFCFKKDAFKSDFKIDYVGMEIPDRFVVGYGLDYDGYGRNFDGIYQLVT
jgi:hypoxanthine phosphoribosyltransferase